MAEVTIPHNVSGEGFFTVENWVTSVASEVLDKELYEWTHVMYVFPDSVEKTFIGYAYYNWYLSLYYDTFTSDLLVPMHEVSTVDPNVVKPKPLQSAVHPILSALFSFAHLQGWPQPRPATL